MAQLCGGGGRASTQSEGRWNGNARLQQAVPWLFLGFPRRVTRIASRLLLLFESGFPLGCPGCLKLGLGGQPCGLFFGKLGKTRFLFDLFRRAFRSPCLARIRCVQPCRLARNNGGIVAAGRPANFCNVASLAFAAAWSRSLKPFSLKFRIFHHSGAHIAAPQEILD